MSIFSKVTTAGLSAAVLATAVMTSVATAAPVAPNKAALILKNPNLGGCTASVKVMARVTAKQMGQVAVRLQHKKTGATAALGWVNVINNPNYGKKNALFNGEKYLGKMTFNAPLPAISFDEKYRVIASGPGKIKYGAWTRLVNKC